jgi:hypothetical protein
VDEDILGLSESPSACPTCGGERRILFSLVAKTPLRWGDSQAPSVNGFFDRGLGASYHTSMEREKIARSKGLIPLEDVGGDNFVEARLSQEKSIKDEQDRILRAYKDKVETYGGSKAAQCRAIEEILPASDCLGNSGAVKALSDTITPTTISE